MRNREEALDIVRDTLGRERLSLRQEVLSGVAWPDDYGELIERLEGELREEGYDEETLGVDDLTEAMVGLIEEVVL